MPMTPFIGVRISWLMLARNSLLAWLALSAASFARCSSCSASLRVGDVDQRPFDDRHSRLIVEQRHALEHPHRAAVLALVAAFRIRKALHPHQLARRTCPGSPAREHISAASWDRCSSREA